MDSRVPKALQMKVSALNRAIFLKDADRAARLFDEVQGVEEGFLLRDPVQFQMAELLEQGEFPKQALRAYELGLEAYGQQKPRLTALLSAGRLAARLDIPEKAFLYLEQYLAAGGSEEGTKEARSIMGGLRKPGVGGGFSLDIDPSTEKLPVGSFGAAPAGSPANPIRLSDDEALHLSSIFNPVEPQSPIQSAVRLPSDFYPRPEEHAPSPARKDVGQIRPRRPGSQPEHDPRPQEPQVQRTLPPRQPMAYDFPITPDPEDGRPQPPMTPETAFPVGSFQNPAHGAAAPPPPPPVPPRQPSQFPPEIAPISPLPAPLPVQNQTPDTMRIHRGEVAEGATESQEERYARLRDGEFALLLPLGMKIKLEAVAEMVAEDLEIAVTEASKRVMRQKGLLYDGLGLQDVLEMKPKVDRCNQSLLFVHVPKSLRPTEQIRVAGVEVKPQGLRLETQSGLRRLRWEDIRLVNSGLLENQAKLTLIGFHPTIEYEFSSDSFNFAFYRVADQGDQIGVAGLIELIRNHAPQAMVTHISQRLLDKKSRTPQVFATRQEYTSYTHYFLFHHFGERIDPADLQEMHEVASDW